MDSVRSEKNGQADVRIEVRDLIASQGGLTMPAAPPPLAVKPKLRWAKDQYGIHAVTHAPIEQAESTGGLSELIRWLHQHEVEPPDNTRLELLVQSTASAAVVLTDLVIAVKARHPAPPAEGLELYSPQLFYKLEPKWFRADLSTHDRVPAVPNLQREHNGEFPYVVHQTEPELFAVDLELGGMVVEWLAELHWTCGARNGVLQISDRGAPFVSRPGAGRPRYDWDWNTCRWVLSRP